MVLKLENDSYQEPLRIAENLRHLFKKHNVNASQVAHSLGLPMMTIRRLLLGETLDPRISTLKILADYFGVPVNTLLDENTKPENATSTTKTSFIPILDWEYISKNKSIRDIDLHTWKNWQPISLYEQNCVSNNAFALESRPSMYPRFPHGTIFVFEPETSPQDGDLVLVKIKSNEITLRELTIDPPQWHLHSIITDSNILNYSKQEHQIIGVVILTMLYTRKVFG